MQRVELQYLQRCKWCLCKTCGEFRRIVGVVVSVVDGGSTSVVDVNAVELIGQLRYQCGLNSNCRRSVLPSIAATQERSVDLSPHAKHTVQNMQHVVT